MLIKCKMCGGDLRPAEGATTCECEYCGSVQTIPKLDNERRLNLYDRANHFRRNNEYDKAMGIFEQILQDDRTDAEAYWSLVLCRYGIEYVEDPATKKRIPTVNRTQLTSIFADEDYKSALEYADAVQKGIYEEEAKAIEGIQKGILDISKKEKPFDVFICYKETDAEGKRTPDSVLANDLYHQLTREGFKVFFSRITLEDKLGQQYEPYIFAALNSAKVMVVLGTRPEYFNAVWVKNEWSRYLALIRGGANKTLVPAYKDMDPYDLPDEFSHLQAQDMSKLGFMQDLIHGIKKLAGEDKPATAQQPVVVQTATGAGGSNAAALLDRAFMALEDGEWAKADDFCEKALNIDARNAHAYIGKLMAELKVRKVEDLQYQAQPIDRSGNYTKAMRFADEKLQATLNGYNDAIKERNEQNRQRTQYNETMQALSSARTVAVVQTIKSRFMAMSGYKDAAKGIKACEDKIESINSSAYNAANNLMKQQQYAQAAAAFRAIGNYRDCQTVAKKCDELEKEKQARIAAEQAEQRRIAAERAAKEEAVRKEKERVAAELKAREDEIRRREAEAKIAKAKKAGLIAALVAVVCVAAFFMVTKVIIPGNNYKSAVALLDAGKYDEASAAFAALGDYQDSAAQMNECAYRKAAALANAGSYDEARQAFIALGEYKDSADMAARMKADALYDAGDYAGAYDVYATLGEAYQTHKEDYASMYAAAKQNLTDGNYDEASAEFAVLGNYSDSAAMATETAYQKAAALAASGDYEGAETIYATLTEYGDSVNLNTKAQADALYDAGDYAGAYEVYATLGQAYQTHKEDYATMYAAAEELHSAKSYDEAYAAYTALGGYSDSAAKAAGIAREKADDLFATGQYQEAADAYAQIGEAELANASTYAYAQQLADAGQVQKASAAWLSIPDYSDSRERNYQLGLSLKDSDPATAYAILAADSTYEGAREAIYQIAVNAADDGNYELAVSAYTTVGAYKDSAMKLQMVTYAWGNQLYEASDYDRAAEVFASMGDFSDVADRVTASKYAAAEDGSKYFVLGFRDNTPAVEKEL